MTQCTPYSPWMWEFSNLWPVVMMHACIILNLSAVEPRSLSLNVQHKSSRPNLGFVNDFQMAADF